MTLPSPKQLWSRAAGCARNLLRKGVTFSWLLKIPPNTERNSPFNLPQNPAESSDKGGACLASVMITVQHPKHLAPWAKKELFSSHPPVLRAGRSVQGPPLNFNANCIYGLQSVPLLSHRLRWSPFSKYWDKVFQSTVGSFPITQPPIILDYCTRHPRGLPEPLPRERQAALPTRGSWIPRASP